MMAQVKMSDSVVEWLKVYFNHQASRILKGHDAFYKDSSHAMQGDPVEESTPSGVCASSAMRQSQQGCKRMSGSLDTSPAQLEVCKEIRNEPVP